MNKKQNKEKVKKSKLNKKYISLFLLILLIITGLIYTQIILPHQQKEDFYRNYNLANEDYKKVLFATGQNNSESSQLMLNYENSFSNLKTKLVNPIEDFKDDPNLMNSINFIENQINYARTNIDNNQLHKAHLDLEEVRKEWLKVFERNNIGMLGVYMTEFHDIMELAAEHDYSNVNYNELENVCINLDESWKKVENSKVDLTGNKLEDYNNKVKIERDNIKNYCNSVLSKSSNLEKLSSKLKKDFISIYLKYG